MAVTDAEIILACRRGDEAAWDALIARYQALVLTIARRSGLSVEEAEDVFQRVFATLVEQLDRIERPELLGAWLVTTTRRESWRARHSPHQRDVVLDKDLERSVSHSNVPEPVEEMLILDERDDVRVALTRMDERCRQLLGLLFDRPDPPSYNEVATTLGVSIGSIGPTRARCLEKLRRLLDDLER